MQMKIHQDADGIMLPEDHEALALLEEERRQDLERIFSPEELFEYEVRTSETAMSLRHQLGGMEPTEEEFREIFRLQAEVNRLDGPHSEGDEEASQRQAEARERMKEELRTSLGEERYRQYERSQDWGYGRLVNVAKRLDLPRERVDQVFDLKEFSENRQQELRADQELSREERETALKTLGSEVRADLNELLGEEGVELYQQNGGHWLYQLPQ